jgi:beta-glucosidase
MSAYNKVNGEYCGHNRRLLTEILRGEWGFEGFVVSDFVYGIRDGKAAALAGLDIEMPFTRHYGRKLRRLVARGEVPAEVIDTAVLRILRRKIRFASVGQPDRYRRENVVCQAHRDLAREAAEKSVVLLRNEPIDGAPALPLDPARVRKLAVLGRLAGTPNIGDGGSSSVRPPYVITPLEGLHRHAPDLEVANADGHDVAAAAAAARGADAAVVVVGYTHADEGEYVAATPMIAKAKGGDRRSLRLPPRDEALVLAVAAANPRTVVVIEGGSAVVTEAWRERVPAIMVAWYPGMEGGSALARLLFGDANPCGKLPCVFPRSAEQLPFFDDEADEIEYGYYHGYRLMEKRGEVPAFAFGYGLSYTTFRVGGLRLASSRIGADGVLNVGVDVSNTGGRAGEEVIQVYVGRGESVYDRPVKELKGFRKILVRAGATARVEVAVPAGELAVWDGSWVVEPGDYRVWVGTSSREEDLVSAEFRVG